MLETIYEVDEDSFRNEDCSKSTKQQSKFSIYMCWCMITGCFIILAFIIMISLNPQYLLSNSSNKHTKITHNVSFHSKEKSDLSMKIIKYLGLFSQQVNKQLDLPSNPVQFLTVPISNSSIFEISNPNGVLWIYGHVKYPSSCINDLQCKEKFHLKLKTSFDQLSNSIKTIDFSPYQNRQIQLDWCNIIENSTSATFISLVSIQILEENSTDSVIPFDPLICEELDQHILLTQTLDDLIAQDNTVLINSNHTNPNTEKGRPLTDNTNNNNNNNSQEPSRSSHNSEQCIKHNGDPDNPHQETTQCHNDIGTQHLLISNLF